MGLVQKVYSIHNYMADIALLTITAKYHTLVGKSLTNPNKLSRD